MQTILVYRGKPQGKGTVERMFALTLDGRYKILDFLTNTFKPAMAKDIFDMLIKQEEELTEVPDMYYDGFGLNDAYKEIQTAYGAYNTTMEKIDKRKRSGSHKQTKDELRDEAKAKLLGSILEVFNKKREREKPKTDFKMELGLC